MGSSSSSSSTFPSPFPRSALIPGFFLGVNSRARFPHLTIPTSFPGMWSSIPFSRSLIPNSPVLLLPHSQFSRSPTPSFSIFPFSYSLIPTFPLLLPCPSLPGSSSQFPSDSSFQLVWRGRDVMELFSNYFLG